MEVYQIRVFLEVARHLSFTEAADALNLTQPAVSAKIKALETELATPLFYRLGRKIQLTEVGQFLYEESPKLIEVEAHLIQKVEEIKKGKYGCLKIGCTTAISEGWLPEILFTYRQHYPGIHTSCVVFDSAEFLYRAISSQQVDLGISDISLESFSEISASVVGSISYSLIMATSHPLSERSWLSVDELQNERWVLLPDGFSSRLVLETRLAELGLSLADFAHVETVDTFSLMRTYLLQGYIGFASNFEFVPEQQAGSLVSVSLQEFALPGSVFLFTPKHLNILTEGRSASTRSQSNNPIQKFMALVQSDRSVQSDPSNQQAARLRSPSFAIRPVQPHRPETITLSIGVQNNTIHTITAGLVMQKLGLLEHFLPREGRYSGIQYQIHWHDHLTGAPIIQGLHNGQLNIGVLGDYPLLLSAVPSSQNCQRTCLVSFVAVNPDGSCNALIVPHRSKIQSLIDLRGRVIAVPFSSSAHSMVMRSLNTANLLTEVRLASLEAIDLAQLVERLPPEADGYAHFAPFHDVACYRGNFRYVPCHDLEPLPAFYGVVANQSLTKHYPEIVIAYLRALKAAQYWYENTASSALLISQWTNVESEIILRSLSSSYCKTNTGRFFSEMEIRSDWIAAHVHELETIPGNEFLHQISLEQWIQPELLQATQANS
jgi:NitT/TauT family transport system substrate-binding protein